MQYAVDAEFRRLLPQLFAVAVQGYPLRHIHLPRRVGIVRADTQCGEHGVVDQHKGAVLRCAVFHGIRTSKARHLQIIGMAVL